MRRFQREAPEDWYIRIIDVNVNDQPESASYTAPKKHDVTQQRETLLLVLVDGSMHEEAAIVLGCRVGTEKSRVSRVRDRLALALVLS